MRSTRPAYLLAALTVGFLGIYWVAGHAQDRPALFPPPAVLPSDPPEPSKAPAKNPKQSKPAADPTLIIPAAVYEEPRPIKSKTETATVGGNVGAIGEAPTKIVQTGGVQLPLPAQVGGGVPSPASPPIFPPLPGPVDKALPEVLPPLPAPALPEPTKALILEPLPLDAPKGLEPPNVPPPLVQAPMGLAVPPIGVPDNKTPLVPAPMQPNREESKAFVRIRTEPGVAMPAMPAAVSLPAMPVALNEIAPIEPAAVNVNLPPPPGGEPVVIASSVQTPTVTLEKRGPTELRAGATVSYQIVVRNQGTVPAQQIRVEDELPQGARFITAEPMPIMNGSKVVWTLAALPANKEQVLRLTLQAGAPSRGGHRTSVQVSATNQVTAVNFQGPASGTNALGMELIVPRQLAIGKPAVFEIHVVNHSEQPLTGLVLHGALPAGLNTAAGRLIEGEIGGVLKPGEGKTLRMPTNVVQAGRFTVAAKVTTQNGQEASASAAIEIGAESLQVQQSANTRIFVGRDGDLRIDVTNSTGRALRNVAVSNALPEGLDYMMASERGLYQANSRTVHWLIDSLPAGATRTLQLRVYGAKPGAYQNPVVAKADGGAQANCMGTINVEGVAELTLRVTDQDRVLEAGRETSYEINLQNPGHAAVSNVRIQVQFPPGMVPKNGQANTLPGPDGQTVVFEPIASLPPQEKKTFRVSAIAQASGDQRVRFSVVSDQTPTPILREVSTLVYRD